MGKPIVVTIPHVLTQIEARRRIAEGFENIRRNKTGSLGMLLSVQDRWDGDRLHFDVGGLGQQVSGQLDVLPNSVEIEVEVPGMLGVIADRLLTALRTQTQKFLE